MWAGYWGKLKINEQKQILEFFFSTLPSFPSPSLLFKAGVLKVTEAGLCVLPLSRISCYVWEQFSNNEKSSLRSCRGWRKSHLCFQQESHACQNPLGHLLFALQPEGPDIVGAPQFGFVHRALIGVFGLLSVQGYGFCKDDWHHRCQLLEVGFNNGS